MASQNDLTNAPDTWDNETSDENVGNQLNKPLASLNINAAAFVPGQNPFAFTFVPSGSSKATGSVCLLFINN